MIRWTHYSELVISSSACPAGATRHTLAFYLFRRYLIITWVWTA